MKTTARAAVDDPGATPHDAILRETAQPSTTRPRSPRSGCTGAPAPAKCESCPRCAVRRGAGRMCFALRPPSRIRKQRRATYPVAVDGPVGARGAHHGTTVSFQEKSWGLRPARPRTVGRAAWLVDQNGTSSAPASEAAAAETPASPSREPLLASAGRALRRRGPNACTRTGSDAP